MKSVVAPAKLNLALHVTGQRTDGYHLLHSLVAFADFGDNLSVDVAQQDGLIVQGPFADAVPALSGNILGEALAMVRAWGVDEIAQQTLCLRLTKNLPIASGIGGGSADAAALISLLTNKRWLSGQEMADCLALGADVPMCLKGRPAIISGIGEDSEQVVLPDAHIVLVNPSVEVSTPAIFQRLTTKHNPPMPAGNNGASFEGLVDYLHATRNDLMPPAISLQPVIQECLDALDAAPFARMSGSGATCFALLKNRDKAEELAASVRKSKPNWWVRACRLAR